MDAAAVVVCAKFWTRFEMREDNSRPPFDYAQGRLSTPLKDASLRMTGLLRDYPALFEE
jgi:hypothetical protein